MARRVAGKAVVRPIPKERRSGRYSNLDLDQIIRGLGPYVREHALDDSDSELLVSWGRTCESRIGMALVVEDAIRAMKPLERSQHRVKIVNAALGVIDRTKPAVQKNQRGLRD